MPISMGDGTYHFCMGFCKVNLVTKSACIYRIGSSKYVTKFNLLKGFWHVGAPDQQSKGNLCICHA